MKAYKFTTVNKDEFKVRFYPTGGVTIVDKDGEHEVGMWEKPEDDSYMYRGCLFGSLVWEMGWKQRDLASKLLQDWFRVRKRNQ